MPATAEVVVNVGGHGADDDHRCPVVGRKRWAADCGAQDSAPGGAAPRDKGTSRFARWQVSNKPVFFAEVECSP